VLAVSAKAVDDGHGKDYQHVECGPARQHDERSADALEAQIVHDRRQHDNRAQCQQKNQKRAGRERERNRIQFDKAAPFLHVVDNVQRVEQRLHSRIGAPQRQSKGEKECCAQSAFAARCDAAKFIADNLNCSVREQRGEFIEVRADRGRVGKDPITETSAAIAGNMARRTKNATPAAIETTRCWPIAL
jgi:hypothetical protein